MDDRSDPMPDEPRDASPDGDAEILAGDELARLGASGAPAGALVTWLEQAHRDAAANRAQARELVRTLEQVRDSQEYVGRALRDERTRSRRLLAALVVAPVLAGLLVWGLWDRLDALRGDVDTRVAAIAESQAEMQRAQDELRNSAEAEAQRIRAEALEAELERTKAELATRLEVAVRAQEQGAETEAQLRARMERLENDSAEATQLRAQLAALRNRSGAESARAEALEAEVRRLERELGAAQLTGSAGVAATSSGPSPADPVRSPELVEPAGAEAAARSAAERAPARAAAPELPPPAGREATTDGDATAEPEPPSVVDPAAGAVRRPGDLSRIRDDLNALLGASSDAVRYRLDALGGVRGETLLDVRLEGVDADGRTIRALEAKTAAVRVLADDSRVVIDLRDGHLLLAGRQAPFFGGRYSVLISGDLEAWRTSGLSCVRFE